ncbi:hypothetical protein N8987_01710 [Crocinitomix sp.]|nr:hypothetical protein [Crocinitomix sp.]
MEHFYLCIFLIGTFAILRIIGLGALLSNNTKPIVLLIFVLISLVVPILGIYAALKSKMDLLKSTSIVLLIFSLRGLSDLNFDTPTIIVLAILISIIFLGLFLPYKMKTPYHSTLIKTEVDGKVTSDYEINFESGDLMRDEELLDTDLS